MCYTDDETTTQLQPAAYLMHNQLLRMSQQSDTSLDAILSVHLSIMLMMLPSLHPTAAWQLQPPIHNLAYYRAAKQVNNCTQSDDSTNALTD